MIQAMSVTGTGTCRNCGAPISRLVGDAERGDGEWRHDPPEGWGSFQRHCPGSPVAEPGDGDA